MTNVRRAAKQVAMRREPTQDRSQARLDRIIAVTEELILKKGLLGLSIREIARAADTNIATFYQFFPSQASLTRHIVEIYNAKLALASGEALAAASQVRDPRKALALIVARMMKFYAENPVTGEIWPSIHADPVLRALDRKDSQQNAERLSPFLQGLRPSASRADIEIAASLIIETAGTVFRYAVRQPPAHQRRLLEGYLDMAMGVISKL